MQYFFLFVCVNIVTVAVVNTDPGFSGLTKLLREISAKFTEEERNKLLRRHKWSAIDVIKACIEADETLLIQGLWQKEIEDLQAVPNKGN